MITAAANLICNWTSPTWRPPDSAVASCIEIEDAILWPYIIIDDDRIIMCGNIQQEFQKDAAWGSVYTRSRLINGSPPGHTVAPGGTTRRSLAGAPRHGILYESHIYEVQRPSNQVPKFRWIRAVRARAR